ncbi:2'-5' RNA ligase family protein [Candidatus Halobonum tyrrellensis]|uniref:Phosphoesterase HXTX n=1 Tax=Candidatus Halobonum tyrrellensis G22 TaxID=1324957 RepID=V4HCG4_9EURY|nr:2'-5' RNA ligase family protein [Candidatus Halobonum tyrrellensis]ESP87748.1 hypothetical protein K933_12523 [Candidatus Halobonum tyrrellensis G22]
MYSLNVPVPGAVRRLAADLAPDLAAFESVRDRHTLVVKRFDGEASLARLRERARPLVAGVAPFEARVTGVDAFETPVYGDGPVVYLAVESDGLREVHERFVAEFGAVEPLEGDDYTPHVTLARGRAGPDAGAALSRLRDREVDLSWTVDELGIWSREYREIAARLPLGGR